MIVFMRRSRHKDIKPWKYRSHVSKLLYLIMLTHFVASHRLIHHHSSIDVSNSIGLSIFKTQTSLSMTQCVDLCRSIPACQFINYDRLSYLCQVISEELMSTYVFKETKSPGMVYGAKREWTPINSEWMETCNTQCGSAYQRCKYDFNSPPTPQTCVHISCGEPPNIENVQEYGNMYGIGNKRWYTCLPGYTLTSNNNQLTCAEDGQWNGTVQCSLLQTTTSGDMSFTSYPNTVTTFDPGMTTTSDSAITTSDIAITTADQDLTTTSDPTTTMSDSAMTTSDPVLTTSDIAITTTDQDLTTTSDSTTTMSDSTVTTSDPVLTTTVGAYTNGSREAISTTITAMTSNVDVTTASDQPTTARDQPTTTDFQSTTTSDQITTTNDQPTTTSDHPTTMSHQPTTTSDQPTTTSDQPTTISDQFTTTRDQPTTTSDQLTTTSDRPTTTSDQLTTTPMETTTTFCPYDNMYAVGSDGYENFEYMIYTNTAMNQANAQQFCESHCGSLMEVLTEAKLNYINGVLPNIGEFWVGAYHAVAGSWTTPPGNVIPINNVLWSSYIPGLTTLTSERCARLLRQSGWYKLNSRGCSEIYPFICEKNRYVI